MTDPELGDPAARGTADTAGTDDPASTGGAPAEPAPGAPGAAEQPVGDRGEGVDGTESITLHEERATVGTERVETGRVRLRKHVVTDTETVEAPVQREEISIERTPIDGEVGGEVSEGDVEVTLHEDRPVVETETVATEQVNMGKHSVQDTQEVTTETAREELDIEGDEGVVRGS